MIAALDLLLRWRDVASDADRDFMLYVAAVESEGCMRAIPTGDVWT